MNSPRCKAAQNGCTTLETMRLLNGIDNAPIRGVLRRPLEPEDRLLRRERRASPNALSAHSRPAESPTRCPYDNEGRSASAVATRALRSLPGWDDKETARTSRLDNRPLVHRAGRAALPESTCCGTVTGLARSVAAARKRSSDLVLDVCDARCVDGADLLELECAAFEPIEQPRPRRKDHGSDRDVDLVHETGG